MNPVLNRLPEYGYQDNPVTSWLTNWSDLELLRVRNILEQWYLELSPHTCQDISLDYLSSLLGFSGVYWDTKWSSSTKRNVLAMANQLWLNRGTVKGLRMILNILVEEYHIWTRGALEIPFSLPSTFGRNDMRVYIKLPLKYRDNGVQFYEAKRILTGYTPAVIEADVVYEQFYLGFSRLGQPLFTV